MHVKCDSVGSASRTAYVSPQRVKRDQGTLAQEDLGAEPFNAAEHTQPGRRKVIYDAVGEVLTGDVGDRKLLDSDGVRTRRTTLSRQQEKIENARLLAGSSYQRGAAFITNEMVERQLRRQLLRARTALRLEARLTVQHCLKKEAAKRAEQEKKQAARVEILRTLGQDEYYWLLSEFEERNLEDAEARARIPAEAERRHPQKMSAEEKRAARKGVKRNKSRQMGLIVGEKQSWSKVKVGESNDGNNDRRADMTWQGLCKDANTGGATCSGKEDHRRFKLSEMQSQSRNGLPSSHAHKGQTRLAKAEDMRGMPVEDIKNTFRRSLGRPTEEITTLDCRIGPRKKTTQNIDAVQPDGTSIEIDDPWASEFVSEILLLTVSCFGLSWSSIYSATGRYLPAIQSVLTVAVCVLKDFLTTFWVRRCHFRHSELPGAFAADFVSSHILGYLAWTTLMSSCGPARAAIAVWLMPIYDCAAGKILTHNWSQALQRPAIEGPFPAKKAYDVHAVRLQSFNVNLALVYRFTLWTRMIEIAGYCLTYLALFSQDSYPSRILAITAAAFIRSRFCFMPQSVREGQLIDQLIRREFWFANETAQIGFPSIIGCFDQESNVFRCPIENLSAHFRPSAQLVWLADADFFKQWKDCGVVVFNTVLSAILLGLSLREEQMTIGLIATMAIASMALGVQIAICQCIMQSASPGIWEKLKEHFEFGCELMLTSYFHNQSTDSASQ